MKKIDVFFNLKFVSEGEKMLLPYALGLVIMFILFVVLSVVGRMNDTAFQRAKPSEGLIFGFIFLVSLIASFQFASFPFSPLLVETDQTVFQYIGARMHEGLVPYTDMFDHKGIILYFIQYIALFIPQHSLGLWLIELINIFVFSVFIYKTAGLYTSSYTIKLITVISITCISGFFVFDGGNYTETYAISWITISLYYFLYFIENNTFKNHSIILAGISFAVVFFLRQNMIAVWLVFIPCIIVLLIKDKNFSGLFRCIGLFLAGCGIVLLPLLVYFLRTDSLKSMIDCYFIFNFAYSGEASRAKQLLAAFVLIFCAGLAVPAFGMSFFCREKKKSYFYNIAFFFISLILASLSALTYSHYAVTLLPAMILPIVYAVKLIYNISDKLFSKKANIKKGVACAASVLSLAAVTVFVLNSSMFAYHKELPETVDYIIKNTEKTDDVLFLGNECLNYYYTDRKTENKYFYQTPPINVSDELADDFLNELKAKPSDFILASGERKTASGSDSAEDRVLKYLESQCELGNYRAEDHDGFFVYIRTE